MNIFYNKEDIDRLIQEKKLIVSDVNLLKNSVTDQIPNYFLHHCKTVMGTGANLIVPEIDIRIISN